VAVPTIAQLVERSTVGTAAIEWSLVRFRVVGFSGPVISKRTLEQVGEAVGVGDLAQMVERSLSMREALGSMPRFSIRFPLSL
jgi:hypothetical protein